MANPGYVKSGAAGDGSGSSWVNANATLTLANVDQVAGDRYWVSDNHAESTATAITLTFPGTLASPNQVYCGVDTATPPTALATSGTVSTTGTSGITVQGSFTLYGLAFNCGDGTGSPSIIVGSPNDRQKFVSSAFNIGATGSTGSINIGTGTGDGGEVEWQNCTVQFSNTSQAMKLRNQKFLWNGGSIVSDAAITALIEEVGAASSEAGEYMILGVDLSNAASSVNILENSSLHSGVFDVKLHGVILPTSWSGSPSAVALLEPGMRVSLYKYMVGTTENICWIRDYFGDIKSETTIKRTSGSSDGAVGYSLKMDTSQSNGANCEWPWGALVTDWHEIWIDATGSKTFTIETLTDENSTAWTNADLVLELWFLDTASSYHIGYKSSEPATLITAAATLAAGTGTGNWGSPPAGFASRKIVVTDTIDRVGKAYWRVKSYRPSVVAYVDTKVAVS